MDLFDCKELFSGKRPEKWEDIPDIDLYMDQVIGYMKRQHIGLDVNENLTSSMVNNYVKQKVMPKASGKKYSRMHIAYLTAICLLKQVISVSEVGTLLDSQIAGGDVASFYDKYTGILDENLTKTNALMSNTMTEDEVSELALRLAISSYTEKLACECLLATMKRDDDKDKK